MNFLKINREILILFIVYFISNLFFLLNFQGIYWDDWTLYNQDFNTIMSQFNMNGGVIAGYIHNILLNIGNGIYIYRLLVFLTFFMSGYFIYKIILNIFNRDIAFWVTIIYLTIPLNSAKIALINSVSILFLSIFFTAFYMLIIYIKKQKSIFYRIIILILFYISFFLNSLLVFYAIVLLYILTKEVKNKPKINLFYKFVFKYIDFILLPIIFFLIKNIYFKPYGLYKGYNNIMLDITRIIDIIKISFNTSFIEPIVISLKTSYIYWYLTLFIFLLIIFLFRKLSFATEYKKNYWLILLGILLFILAVFPYAAVGKIPRLDNWWSRHQILLPLGVSFVIVWFFIVLNKFYNNTSKFVLAFIVSIFIVQDLYYGYRYIKDWFYQVSIEENFKKSIIIKKHTTFIENLKLDGMLANKRNLSFYEQNGRLKKVFGNTKHLMVENIRDISAYKIYRKYKQYNFYQWKFDGHLFIVTISNSNKIMDFKSFINLLYWQFIDYKVFINKIIRFTSIRIKELKYVK